MVQKITRHALSLRLKVDRRESEAGRRLRLSSTVVFLSCCLTIVSSFVNDKSMELAYVAVQGLKVLARSFEGLSSSGAVGGAVGGPSSPLPDDGHRDRVRAALLVAVPSLVRRMSARRTPKELKRAVCKTILAISRSGKVDGLNVVVPFLTSPKFAPVARLFVLKLLTKEFGLDRKGCPLSCPMVLTVALEALAGKIGKVDEKVSRKKRTTT